MLVVLLNICLHPVLIGYSCALDDFRLQKQRAAAVVLNYLHIAFLLHGSFRCRMTKLLQL